VLSPLTVTDAADMVLVLEADSLYAFIGGGPPALDQLRRRYERQVTGRSDDGSQDWLNWIMRERDHRQPVGTVQATVVDEGRRGDVAWVVGVPWQRRGFAREAAMALVLWLRSSGVGLVTAHIHPDHRASAAVARAAGLRPTGAMHDGEQRWELTDPPT